MASKGVPGICEIDTRALTYRLREGVTLGRIIQGVAPFGPLPPLKDPNARNLVAEVSVKVNYNKLYFYKHYSLQLHLLFTTFLL